MGHETSGQEPTTHSLVGQGKLPDMLQCGLREDHVCGPVEFVHRIAVLLDDVQDAGIVPVDAGDGLTDAAEARRVEAPFHAAVRQDVRRELIGQHRALRQGVAARIPRVPAAEQRYQIIEHRDILRGIPSPFTVYRDIPVCSRDKRRQPRPDRFAGAYLTHR